MSYTIKNIAVNQNGVKEVTFENLFQVSAQDIKIPNRAGLNFKIYIRAYHDQSKKMIDLPPKIALRLVHSTVPLLDVSEAEADYILAEVAAFKKLEGEWTDGLVKPPRDRTLGAMLSEYLRSDIIGVQSGRYAASVMHSIAREENWGGATIAIPYPEGADEPAIYRSTSDYQTLERNHLAEAIERREREERARYERMERERIENRIREQQRAMARPIVRIDRAVDDEFIDW
jgi:hypothetical protein